METNKYIIEERIPPGVMLLDQGMNLMDINMSAKDLLDKINGKDDSSKDNPAHFPDEIVDLLDDSQGSYTGTAIINREEDHYLARVTPLHKASEANESQNISYVMVVIEKCTTQRLLDYASAISRYNFTKREVEVVENIVQGHTNQQISEVLFISEHTVKDHIRNIMLKMKVPNRTSILSKIYT